MKENSDKAVSPIIGVILMVAITVILAAVAGTFLLGLGDNLSVEPNSKIQITQSGQSTEIVIASSGNLEGLIIVGASGERSYTLREELMGGTEIIIANNLSKRYNIKKTDSGENLVDGEDCMIRHREEKLYGVEVNGADIGCSGSRLKDLGADNPSLNGSEIIYKEEGQYQLIGVVGRNKAVIQKWRIF